MKKLLFSIAAAAAMLVSCSEKEITVPETGSGEPFSFHASILADKAQDTKTTLTIEGTAEEPQYKVAWDEGDRPQKVTETYSHVKVWRILEISRH